MKAVLPLRHRATALAVILGLSYFASFTPKAFAQGDFAIKDGDKVVFYGDSITDSRSYTLPAEAFIVTRFPNMKVDFVHSGWSGDTVNGGGGGNIDTRLSRDVFTYKPSVVTVMLGMNDGGYKLFNQETFDKYTKGYTKLTEAMKAALPGVRMTFIEPSPFDDVTRAPNFEGGYNAVLQKYGAFVRDLAAQQGHSSADLNAPVVAMLTQAFAKSPDASQNLIRDRVHPGGQAGLIMAGALLKAWNAPAIVSSVEIDGAAGKVTAAVNTAVTNLAKGESVTWTQTDMALPMPLNFADSLTNLALNSSDFIQTLDQQPLKVTGLAAGKYTLSIDGEIVGSFQAEQLAAGINLATMQTPMLKQSLQVLALTDSHLKVHQTRWRGLQVPILSDTFPAVQAAAKTALPVLLDALDQEEADLVAKQRAAAVPVGRKFEVKAAG